MKRLPWLAAAAAVLWLLSGLLPARSTSAFNVHGFAVLPVVNNGRVKPIDSVARNSLLVLSGRQTVATEKGELGADDWLLKVLYDAPVADQLQVFTIDNPDVVGLLNLQGNDKRRRFSYEEMAPSLKEIDAQSQRADEINGDRRTPFQRAIVQLRNHLLLYQRLENAVQKAGETNVAEQLARFHDMLGPAIKAMQEHVANGGKGKMPKVLVDFSDLFEEYRFLSQFAEFFPLPPLSNDNSDWMNIGQALFRMAERGELHPGVNAYVAMGESYRKGNAAAFNMAVSDFTRWLEANRPADLSHARHEELFNRYEPFLKSMTLYVVVFLVVSIGWMLRSENVRRTAFALLLVAFIAHTVGLVSRMVLQGRPPVTNLYSSAIFIGWVVIILGIVFERLFKNGVGSFLGSVIGFTTLIIAHHLASEGDTMEMMRAVLDSNFWLATHVVTITVGYSGTFVAGFIGAFYVLRGAFTRTLTPDAGRALVRMAYGATCFATLFSFIGTILGGIWADQSWGRFWGWDPKENGALMIVLWNALILHVRWGRFAGDRRLMALTVFGNVVTALSWFGVNMLGIGLHSYGFMDKAFFWLIAFVISQAIIMAIGLMPAEQWRSDPVEARPD